MKERAAAWGLLLLGIIIAVAGFMGAIGRLVAVVFTPGALQVNDQ